MDVTRSEEALRLTRAWRPLERLRVGKRVVTEERTVTLRLRREELVLERVPVADGSLQRPGPPQEPVVLVLREEQAEITTRVVPVEQVRVTVERRVEAHDVTTDLRAEQVEVAAEPLP